MTEALIGRLSRTVTFAQYDCDRVVTGVTTFPAGTEVYVERIHKGVLTVRVPGSLWTQRVGLSSVEVP